MQKAFKLIIRMFQTFDLCSRLHSIIWVTLSQLLSYVSRKPISNSIYFASRRNNGRSKYVRADYTFTWPLIFMAVAEVESSAEKSSQRGITKARSTPARNSIGESDHRELTNLVHVLDTTYRVVASPLSYLRDSRGFAPRSFHMYLYATSTRIDY